MKMNEKLHLKVNNWLKPIIQKVLFIFLMVALWQPAQAQEIEISGTVTEQANDEVLPGVSIIIKGTTSGTITDYDGNYNLKASIGDILLFKYVGYLEEEIELSNQSVINIGLTPDLVGLDEVVVIGYGVQKKKLNTGSTINVKGEDLQKLNTVSPMDALKGNSAGVNITAKSGVPGAGTQVIIRGAGTMGDASPLYVVDGVPVGNIDFLSPSDIASIDILKDAASTAIYGSRAANGVILVTTKKGTTKGKPTISYDMYYGWQQIAKRPGLNDAQTYMQLNEEAWAYDDKEIDWAKQTGLSYWEDYRDGTNPGTNWFNELYNENAPTQSHALNVTGGTEQSNYSMGVSYLTQQGIIGFAENSTYDRLNARINSEHRVIEHNGRSILKVGENFSFSNYTNPNIATGNIYWNDLHNALTADPILPMHADENTPEEYGEYHQPLYWNPFGGNPVGSMEYFRKYQENDNNNMVGNAYMQLEPIQNLVIRSSYGFDASFGRSRSYRPAYQLSAQSFDARDNVSQSAYQNYTSTWTNTASYSFDIQSAHNFTTMVGQEARSTSLSYNVGASNDSTIYQDWDHAYINNTHNNYSTALSNMWGEDKAGYGMLSYFGRISYDYNETLLATFVYRADGSNNLAPGHQWGDFMSGSLGYILTNHDFMSGIPGLNYLKIRGGWGQNGNERIDPFQYNSALERAGSSYFFANDKTSTTSGFYPALTPNQAIGWETSEQTSVGFDANFLDNRLQFNFDWYNKTTKDWLVNVPKPLSNGTSGAIENGGAVVNKGVELALKWTESRGDFKYSASATLAYNKNEVTELAADGGYFNGNANILQQGATPINRVEVGYPIGYFRGYKTDGILQNAADVAAYVKPDTLDGDGNTIPYFKDAQPGDIKFVDQNGDGKITDDDKVQIGNPTPKYIFGFTLSADYKGAYISVTTNGAAGHQIAMATLPNDEYLLGRWHGEGTSNTQPRLSRTGSHRNELYVSDYYMHDADFLRISNITIGYDFNRLFNSSPLGEARLYVTGQNLFTFTKYVGLDPEVGYGGDVNWGSGIDLGLYPLAKTYMIGLSVKF